MQVSVLDTEEYQVPVGNQPKEGSRKERRRAQYTPRAQQRSAQQRNGVAQAKPTTAADATPAAV